ncbi:MAG: multicopper oxidase family protein [Thermoproteota archaeon]|nr:multicopper oxidase family protein [Thermoproteota archaeon]
MRYRYQVSVVITIIMLTSASIAFAAGKNNMVENLFFPFVNGQGKLGIENPGHLTQAILPQPMQIGDGTTFHLSVGKVVNNINGNNVVMYGLNGQILGPIIKVKQSSTIFVNFTNNLDMDSTIHWHGLKLNNKYDGVPGLTQDPVKHGQSYLYKLDFPNEGVYWYHSHFREDKQQGLGMYGIILVEPKTKNYYNPVNVEVPLTLADILMVNGSIYPYNNDHETFALMGRYGNVMLLNGQTNYQLDVNKGQAVRFFLADNSNARPYNFTIEGHKLKLVGGDSGKYEHESLVNSVILSPAEREIVEVLFDKPGDFKILNVTPEKTYQLGTINVSNQSSAIPLTTINTNNSTSFYTLKENKDIIDEIQPYTKYLNEKPDYTVDLTVKLKSMANMAQMGGSSQQCKKGNNTCNIEWNVPPAKVKMNEDSTPATVNWILKDNATGKQLNCTNIIEMKTGDIKKIRLYNDPNSAHPMQHPIHIHGLRFLVLSLDGKVNDNLGWKDTVLVPTGSTVDILLVADNPGLWTFHCHISEHMGAGMESVIKVT